MLTSGIESILAKRDFDATSEPRGTGVALHSRRAILGIQKHLAQQLLFNRPLELDCVLKSSAAPAVDEHADAVAGVVSTYETNVLSGRSIGELGRIHQSLSSHGQRYQRSRRGGSLNIDKTTADQQFLAIQFIAYSILRMASYRTTFAFVRIR